MSIFRHACVRKTVPKNHPLFGKVVYVPAMAEGSAQAFCAVCASIPIQRSTAQEACALPSAIAGT